MSGNSYDGFFIGWGKKLPKGLSGFLIVVSLFMVGLFAGTAFSFVVSQDDPGDGAFRGRQNVTGVMQAAPYPVVHIPPGDKYPNGHSIMLSGGGKRGVQNQAEPLDGQVVQVRGALLKRGDLDMIQVGRRIQAVKDSTPHEVETTSLGRWKLSGEICDGKCYAGAMRPGKGLAHKACANLCLIGGVPAIFVSSGPVDGSIFFMLADADGKALGDRLYDMTAVLLSAEGEIEKRGDLHLFKIDLDSVEVQ
ncbi:MAG: hypothetical protein ABJM29_00735 [Rhizobiaceae bacterium]